MYMWLLFKRLFLPNKTHGRARDIKDDLYAKATAWIQFQILRYLWRNFKFSLFQQQGYRIHKKIRFPTLTCVLPALLVLPSVILH